MAVNRDRVNKGSATALGADSQPTRQTVRLLAIWVQGFLIATALVWLLGFYFVDQVSNLEFNEIAQEYVQRGRQSWRSEGFGTVLVPPNGVLGSGGGFEDGASHIVFWGDSFVESYQVGDANSIYTRFTEIAEGEGNGEIRGVAVARSDRDASHHLYLMPRYKAVIPTVKANIVVLAPGDIIPHGATLRLDGVPVWRHVDAAPPPYLAIKRVMREHKLHSFWYLMKQAAMGVSHLRLAPGPVKTAHDSDESRKPADYLLEELEPFWRELIGEFVKREQECGRTILMLHQEVPKLERSQVRMSDPSDVHIERFMELCNEQGLEVINLSPEFVKYYEETGKFAHGFFNTYPSRGHWNRDGHSLAARAAWDYLQFHPPSESEGEFELAERVPPTPGRQPR